MKYSSSLYSIEEGKRNVDAEEMFREIDAETVEQIISTKHRLGILHAEMVNDGDISKSLDEAIAECRLALNCMVILRAFTIAAKRAIS
jgi:hypothetical protein